MERTVSKADSPIDAEHHKRLVAGYEKKMSSLTEELEKVFLCVAVVILCYCASYGGGGRERRRGSERERERKGERK